MMWSGYEMKRKCPLLLRLCLIHLHLSASVRHLKLRRQFNLHTPTTDHSVPLCTPLTCYFTVSLIPITNSELHANNVIQRPPTPSKHLRRRTQSLNVLPVPPSQLITCHRCRACFIIRGGNHLKLSFPGPNWERLTGRGEMDGGHFSQRRDRENALENMPLRVTRLLRKNKIVWRAGNCLVITTGVETLNVNTTVSAFCCFDRPVWQKEMSS